MKRLVVASAVAIAVLTVPTFAQQSGTDSMKGMEGMKDMDMSKPQAMSPQTVHKGTGVIKKLDPTAGTVTINHGPVATMTFKVKDKSLMSKLAVDKKVDFEFIQQGKDYVVTDAR